MPLQAAFAETDITPPVGTRKIGWIRLTISDRVLDPLFARVAILKSGEDAIAFVQLDTLSIRWTQVNDIRERVSEVYGFPGTHVMVSATHNHAGPAVTGGIEFEREEEYIEEMLTRIVLAFGQALENLQPAEVGFGSAAEFRVAHNRRVIMRDGTTKTHGNFSDADALCFEGPIDPELAVISVRSTSGDLLGALVNYACHPTHHGAGGELSAGYPGILANELKARGCPVPLFLNGAAGNIHTGNPADRSWNPSKEEVGLMLAEKAAEILDQIEYRPEARLASRITTLQLPYRNPTEEEIKGAIKGAQRFVDPALYDKGMPVLLELIRTRGTQPADVQVNFIDDWAVAGIPAEYFVELGLRIKEEAYPAHALVAAYTNGMIGYVPHRAAFDRGGYETTLGCVSRMAPETGDLLADAAVELFKQQMGS